MLNKTLCCCGALVVYYVLRQVSLLNHVAFSISALGNFGAFTYAGIGAIVILVLAWKAN